MVRHPIPVVLALVAGLAFLACCRDLSLGLWRVRDFLSGVLDISLTVDAEIFVSTGFEGDFDDWSDIPLFDDGEIETDLTAAAYSGALFEIDLDFDGIEEKTSLILAEGAAASGNRPIFVAWEGDSYTVDKGVCYLGWAENGDVKLAAARCGQSTGVMYCSMPQNSEDLARCELCPASGACTPCDMDGELDDCLPEKEAGGSIDIDIDIDADIDLDMDADRSAGEP
ncbi:MAG TPA: hypothetical protein VM285_06650 [Polyangia bacterium]|nr:hypothetical protein [Polyangia bacterium]